MIEAAPTPCAGCQRLQEQLDQLQAKMESLEEQLAKARKNSSTSSKPPSSDIVKPPPPAPGDAEGKRSQGAQPGHPKHERAPFPPELITSIIPHVLDLCPDCGLGVQSIDHPPRVFQQVDVREFARFPSSSRNIALWLFGVPLARRFISAASRQRSRKPDSSALA